MEKKRKQLPSLCEKCQKNKAEMLHTCCYLVEIYEDAETKCNCCTDCSASCAEEV